MSTRHLAELGHHLASRSRARLVREQVVAEIQVSGQPCDVDLTDVLSVSDSFADEFFAVLAADYGDEWFRSNIRIDAACDVVRGSIVRAIGARLDRVAGRPQRDTHRGFQLAPPPAHLP